MRTRRAPRLDGVACIALGASALLASAPAFAHAPDTYGFGSRSAAMGSAVTADATDFSASYYNPAGLAGAPGLVISLGYTYAWNGLRMNGLDNDVANVHGLVGGLVAPGKLFGVLPFAFGIATFIPDEGLSRIKALRQETPRWELYDDRLSLLFLAASVAIRPVSFLELGGGIAFLAATRGRFAVTGRADVLYPYDSQLRHEVDADLTSVRYPHLGARVRAGDLGFIGLAYRGETKLPLSIDANLKGVVDFAGVEIPIRYALESRTVDGFLPQQVALGASLQKIEGLRVNVDLTWVNWSSYESPTARTTTSLDVDPPPGVPLELPENPKPTTPLPPAFEDRLVPRVGLEYVWALAGSPRRLPGEEKDRRAVEVPVRAGYVFERSPVPEQTGVTNFADADRHTFTFGTGVALNAVSSILPGALRLDVHGQVSVLPERTMKKRSPADFVGDYTASGVMTSLGATLAAAF
jgi:long-chain fatty acid transport protein